MTPLPMIMGKRITRAEVIEALRECYQTSIRFERAEDPSFRGYPDFETILDHIEEHGLPPKVEKDLGGFYEIHN